MAKTSDDDFGLPDNGRPQGEKGALTFGDPNAIQGARAQAIALSRAQRSERLRRKAQREAELALAMQRYPGGVCPYCLRPLPANAQPT